jgi:hypothetical protein
MSLSEATRESSSPSAPGGQEEVGRVSSQEAAQPQDGGHEAPTSSLSETVAEASRSEASMEATPSGSESQPSQPSQSSQLSQSTPATRRTERSDPEQRIRELQSQADRARAELLKMTRRAQEAEEQLKAALAERTQLLTSAAEAAQKAMDENANLKQELEQTRGELARLKLLQQRPELLPYADLLPATTDEQKLAEMVERLEQARQRDLEQLRRQAGVSETEAAGTTGTMGAAGRLARNGSGLGGSSTPVVSGTPARLSVPTAMSPEELNRRLREAMRQGPKAYQEALSEAILLVNSGKVARET